MRKGGRGVRGTPEIIVKVERQRIILVDWDDIERREAAGEKITSATWNELQPKTEQPTAKKTIFD